jgi:hypothetical protein
MQALVSSIRFLLATDSMGMAATVIIITAVVWCVTARFVFLYILCSKMDGIVKNLEELNKRLSKSQR